MLSPEKAGLLTAFLGGLPERVALRLAKAVEVDRLAGGTALPHDLILEALRPVLRKTTHGDRTPTPLRWFCEPFEDLLVSEPRKEKRKGRIARDSVIPVWRWISETLAPVASKAYVAVITEAVLGFRLQQAEAHAAEFWVAAAEALRSAIAADRKQARLALGSEATLADAEEMVILLSAGRDIADLKRKLPRDTAALNDDLVWTLRAIYDRIVANVPDAAPYVAVIAMSRLERPWEALKLPLQISRQTSDTLISSTDIGLAGEVLLGDLDVHTAAIRVVKHPNFDPERLAAHVSEFARLSNGLTQEVDLRRDGTWHQRLMKDRTAVADTMETLMERAPREILAALPVHKTGSYGGGPKAPDIGRPADAEKTERGLRYARLLVVCRKFAAAASFGAAQKEAFNEACLHLKSYRDDIVREVRAAEGARRVIAEQYFAIATEFMAILFSEEEAEFLRRRGRAAMADAA
jgi:hypothetical protein